MFCFDLSSSDLNLRIRSAIFFFLQVGIFKLLRCLRTKINRFATSVAPRHWNDVSTFLYDLPGFMIKAIDWLAQQFLWSVTTLNHDRKWAHHSAGARSSAGLFYAQLMLFLCVNAFNDSEIWSKYYVHVFKTFYNVLSHFTMLYSKYP